MNNICFVRWHQETKRVYTDDLIDTTDMINPPCDPLLVDDSKEYPHEPDGHQYAMAQKPDDPVHSFIKYLPAFVCKHCGQVYAEDKE